jgi:hypothetical protein
VRVVVEPLANSPVSSLLSMFSDISQQQREMFDYCQTLGQVYTGFVDGEFVCCWGLIPPSFLSNQAYLWMWAPEPMRHQFTFIRQSQIHIQKMLERYDTIVGQCVVTNRSAQRWLKWLGAEFEYPHGNLISFTIRKNNG